MRHFGQTNFPVAPRAQIRSAKTAAAEGLCNISALAPTTSPCAMLSAIFSVDAGVSEIPAWSFLDAIPMATGCGALDAVALADFSTAKKKQMPLRPSASGASDFRALSLKRA